MCEKCRCALARAPDRSLHTTRVAVQHRPVHQLRNPPGIPHPDPGRKRCLIKSTFPWLLRTMPAAVTVNFVLVARTDQRRSAAGTCRQILESRSLSIGVKLACCRQECDIGHSIELAVITLNSASMILPLCNSTLRRFHVLIIDCHSNQSVRFASRARTCTV